jgi:hypothetical protein
MNIAPDLLAQLVDCDDVVYVDDDTRVRLLIERDPDTSINDYDSDGKVSECAYDYRDREYRQRPDGFTGRARKIEVDRGLVMWWEPRDDLMGWQDEAGDWHHAKWDQLPRHIQQLELQRITDLLRDGFKQVGLRLEHRIIDTAYNSAVWHQVDTAWVGGCDSVYPELIAYLAAELPEPRQEAA